MSGLITLLKAIIALPKIGGYVEDAVKAVVGWYISNQQSEALKDIADAAATASHAKTKEERLNAAAKWSKVLSRARFIDLG